MKEIKLLTDMLVNSRDVAVLTGAGASTESGIPDFRSPDTGLWSKIDPMELFARQVLEADPELFWRRAAPVFRNLGSAQPNRCHQALYQLEAKNLIGGIITQNIDDLHQRAGSQSVLEVHGHLRTASCYCGEERPMNTVLDLVEAGDGPPRCDCGLVLRPDVVLFGDPLPPAFDRAWQWCQTCDLLLVVGSSLEVAPVCWLVTLPPQVAIVNLSETSYDDMAALVIRGKAGEVLAALVESISST